MDAIEVLREIHRALLVNGNTMQAAQVKEASAELTEARTEIEVLCATLARTKEQTVLAFARFLHSIPAENGWDVGPARVKYSSCGAVEGGPLWATQEDTERWALAFLAGPNV